MDPRPYLNLGGDTTPVDLNDLDDDIRWGRVPGSAKLRYPPWTGERFLALEAIPELAEALDSSGARLARTLRTAPFPWASTLFTVALFGGVALQIGSSAMTDFDPAWAVHRFFERYAATGYEPLMLDGQWWTPWSSQFTHAGIQHFLSNIAVVGYCGFRTERALGAGGFAVVLAASVMVPAILLALLTPHPVVGSSLAGFGLFGAIIAIGFRFGDQIPRGWRRGYGFSNLWLFAVLAVGTLGSAAVSHLGHAGGLIGGAVAVFLLRPETQAPAARFKAARARNLGIALALALVPCVLVPLLGHVPALAFGAPEDIALEDHGVTLSVPARLMAEVPKASSLDRMGLPEVESAPYVRTVDGLPAWTTSPGSTEVVFAGSQRLRSLSTDDLDQSLAERWQRLIGGEIQAADAPPPKGEGWTDHALLLVDEENDVRIRVVEHRLIQGRRLVRAGYLVGVNEDGEANVREPAFSQVVDSVVALDPPDLAAAREDYERNPDGERVRLELARQLLEVGQEAEAEALFAAVATGEGKRAREAVGERLALWSRSPDQYLDPAEPAWFERWLEPGYPTRQILDDGIDWLLHHGRCEAARGHLEAFEAPPERLVGRVSEACGEE